jgi:hypothetical protein
MSVQGEDPRPCSRSTSRLQRRQRFIPIDRVMRRRKLRQSVRQHREGIVCAVGRRRHGALLVLFQNGRAIELSMDAEFAQWLAEQIHPPRRSARPNIA